MLRRSAISILLALASASMSTKAFAAIFFVGTEVANPPGTPFAVPEAALSAPWRSYQLTLEATAGEIVGAVDVTIEGPLHQRWGPDSDFNGVADPTPLGPPGGAANMRGDSHLTAPAGSPFGVPASETNSKTGSPLPSNPGNREYGLGGLRGEWAIVNPQPVTNLAYMVVSSDRLADFDFVISAKDPQGGLLPVRPFFTYPPIAVDEHLGNRIRGALIHHTLTLQQGMGFSWGNLQVAGPNGATPATPPVLHPDGTFSWRSNIDDASLGQWIFHATAANEDGSDVATLIVNLVIPEPGTIALAGLAAIGAVGFCGRILRKR